MNRQKSRRRYVSACYHLVMSDSVTPWTPGSSVHGALQASILEWVAFLFSRGSFWPRDWTQFSLIAARFFAIWATRDIVDLKNTVNQFNIMKHFHTTGYKFYSSSLDYKPGDTRLYPGMLNKVEKFNHLKLLKSYRVCSLIPAELCSNQCQKILENNPHIFKCSVTFTKRDLWLSHCKSQ